jgi:hypothetical protein
MSHRYPEAFVDTPLGRLHVWATDERTLHAATMTADQKRQSDYHHDPAAQDCAEHLVINRIPYSLHLRLLADSHPELASCPPTRGVHHGWAVPSADGAVRLRRADNDLLPGTKGAVNRVHALVVHALTEWAASPTGSVVCLRAEASRVETRIAQVQASIAEHQQELDRLHQHRRAIATRLAIVRRAGGEDR